MEIELFCVLAWEDDTDQLVFVIGVLGVLLDQQSFRYALVAFQIVSVQDFAEIRLLDQRPVIIGDDFKEGTLTEVMVLFCVAKIRTQSLIAPSGSGMIALTSVAYSVQPT